MIIVILSKVGMELTACQIIQDELRGLNFKMKSVFDLPSYRPNRQLFGEFEFDNWIITDCETEKEFKELKEKNPLVIHEK